MLHRLDAPVRPSVTRLAGKVAIITGGGTGIGLAIATSFAKEGAGIVITGRRPEKLTEALAAIRKCGCHALSVTADVSRAADVQRTVEEAEKSFGKIDILVNN